MKLEKYNEIYAKQILKWCSDERAFYEWSAGVLGKYPIGENEFNQVKNVIPFVYFNDDELIGFFTLRYPNTEKNEVRMGFIIIDPNKRGNGYGKEMIKAGLEYAREDLRCSKVSLGVFENNIVAYNCYKAVGFKDIVLESTEKYCILNKEWKCRELEMDLYDNVFVK